MEPGTVRRNKKHVHRAVLWKPAVFTSKIHWPSNSWGFYQFANGLKIQSFSSHSTTMSRSMWHINEPYHIVENQATTTQSQKGHEELRFEKIPKEPLGNTANTLSLLVMFDFDHSGNNSLQTTHSQPGFSIGLLLFPYSALWGRHPFTIWKEEGIARCSAASAH